MKKLKDRIRSARKKAGFSQVELAELAGTTQSSITNLETGRHLHSSHLPAIASILDVDLLWLINGDEGQEIPRSPMVPLVSWVQAGNWRESVEDVEDWFPAPPKAGPNVFALRVIGDSMTSPYPGQRTYPEGSIIYADPDMDAMPGMRVIVRFDGETTFKELSYDSGELFLRPLNPQYPTRKLPESATIVGVVIGTFYPG